MPEEPLRPDERLVANGGREPTAGPDNATGENGVLMAAGRRYKHQPESPAFERTNPTSPSAAIPRRIRSQARWFRPSGDAGVLTSADRPASFHVLPGSMRISAEGDRSCNGPLQPHECLNP